MKVIKTVDLWTEQYENQYECFNGAFVDGFENNNVLVSVFFFLIQVAIEDCNDFSLKSSAGKASSEIANSHCAETLCPFVLV